MPADPPLGVRGWEDLVKIAVVGTSRLAGRFTDEPEQRPDATGLVRVLAEVQPGPTRPPERAVLAAAAALRVARKAASPTASVTDLAAPAPVLDGLAVSGALARMMPTLLADQNRPVLDEVVERCAQSDLRLPPIALPPVLEIASSPGASGEVLRANLRVVAGERGRWLAQRNPRWSWLLPAAALPEDPTVVWDTGSRDDRLALLRSARSVAPSVASGLVQRTWRADRAPERASFVAAFFQGLSIADEPFLEEVVLADRAREVRHAACRLLDRLPTSRRGARMRARADRIMEVVHSPGAIAELPADWVADGIERGNGSARAIAARVLEATPLDHWGSDMGSVLARLTPSDATRPPEELLSALGRAAVHQQRHDWMVGLLEHGGPHRCDRTLLRAVPVPAGAGWLTRMLAKGSALDASRLMELAHCIPRPWPAGLVAEFLRRGVDILSLGRAIPGDVAPHLHLVGERADAALLARLVPDLAAIRTHDVRLERGWRDAHAVAHLRLTVTGLIEASAGPPS